MMPGKFMTADEIVQESPAPGFMMGWISRPKNGAEKLLVIDVTWNPGQGHPFHRHPNQEEVIFVLEGNLEQWLEQDKKILSPGEGAFIPADLVHGSYNSGDVPVRVIVIQGPCIGEDGYDFFNVDEEEPWKSLR